VLSSMHIQTMIISRSGKFWIGTWEGLIQLDIENQSFELYSSKNKNGKAISGEMIFNLAEDNYGNIYCLSADGGLSVYLNSEKKFKIFKSNPYDKNSIPSNRLMSVLIDKNEKVWIGTFDKGLIYFDPIKQTFKSVTHNPSLESSLSIGAVMCLFEDKFGGIWIGTGGGGVNHYVPSNQNFIHYKYIPNSRKSISPNPILAICEDRDGNLYVGSDGGGLNFKSKNSDEFQNFLQAPKFGSNAISAIYEDRKGNIWIGIDPGFNSKSGVLMKFNKNSKSFSHEDNVKIKIGGIFAILEDRFGELWIATYSDGLHRYNPNTKTEIVYKNVSEDTTSISSNSVTSIYEDRNGNLWFGTIASGLNLFNREKNLFIRFVNNPKDKSSLSSNSIWCITEDEFRNIWIGTWGGGLNKLERKSNSFVRYTTDDGLPSNIIYGILEDTSGNLWISTNKGLSRFDTRNSTFRNYDKSDGLLIYEFSSGAYFKTKDGRFYFGGKNGLICFHPSQLIENDLIPNVVITDFKIFDKSFFYEKSIPLLNEVKLNYDQNFITIEFASLDFTSPKKNKYEFILEGVDENWVSLSGRNFASYTKLSDGEYTFKVRGSNSSGIFNPNETLLKIIITPPFWKTWWFSSLIILVFLLLIYLLHKYRLNKLLEVERTRLKISRDLHDEVSASITGIVYFTEAIKSDINSVSSATIKNLINLIGESAKQIQNSMKDIIWSINPDNDDWSVVLPKLRRYASDICESKGIKYLIDIPETFSIKSLRMEQRHDFWLLYKEILTNAVKHSECSTIEIKLFVDDANIHLEIKDDGVGFNPDLTPSNNGLKNINARVKSLGGTAELKSKLGEGTKWSIKFPLAKKRKYEQKKF
ncbi:MAG: ATP-binding protein, partial [Ignavibacterium sp.]|nr:ATP-binding protein [Ignavibacterium sp.]